MITQNPRIFVFDGGTVQSSGVRFIAPDGSEQLRDMTDPNHCYLIQHSSGFLLWDTSLPDSIYDLPGNVLQRGERFRFFVRQTLAAQFAALSIQPAQVRKVAYSHLQIDHAGNAGLFVHAQALLQQAEFDMAFSPEAAKWGYRLEDYAGLSNQQFHLLDGDHDVFGDGQVVILSAPGHTPGHQVLLVRLPGGPVLLSGDLYYAASDPSTHWMPYWNTDREETLGTMRRLDQIAAQTGARWIINHEPDPTVAPPTGMWIE